MTCPKCHCGELLFERSSGYAGYRCKLCDGWHYEKQVTDYKRQIQLRKQVRANEITYGQAFYVVDRNDPNLIEQVIDNDRIVMIYADTNSKE